MHEYVDIYVLGIVRYLIIYYRAGRPLGAVYISINALNVQRPVVRLAHNNGSYKILDNATKQTIFHRFRLSYVQYLKTANAVQALCRADTLTITTTVPTFGCRKTPLRTIVAKSIIHVKNAAFATIINRFHRECVILSSPLATLCGGWETIAFSDKSPLVVHVTWCRSTSTSVGNVRAHTTTPRMTLTATGRRNR